MEDNITKRVDKLVENSRAKEKIIMSRMNSEEKLKHLPDYIVYHILGVSIEDAGENTVIMKAEGREMPIHKDDYDLVIKIAEKIKREVIGEKEASKYDVIRLRHFAEGEVNDILTCGEKKYRLLYMMGDYFGCGWYRANQMAKFVDRYCVNLKAICTDQVSYSSGTRVDAIVAQRIVTLPVFNLLKEWKSRGKKIIYEIDDLLEDIPDFNPFKKENWSELKIQEANALAELSDIVVTSTDLLAEYYKEKFNKPVIVVPNFIDRGRWFDKTKSGDRGYKGKDKLREEDKERGTVRILWAGSPTHAGDFGEVNEALRWVLREYSQVKLVFFGYVPKDAEIGWRARYEYTDWVSWQKYPDTLYKLDGEIAIAPLVNIKFNKYKSNIKFLEYSRLKIPTIASNMEPYRCIKHKETGFLANNIKEWKEYLVELIETPELRVRIGGQAQKQVNETYNGEKIVQGFEKKLQEVLS